MPMPSWWKGKSSKSSNPSAPASTKVSPRTNRSAKDEKKARSFDEAVAARAAAVVDAHGSSPRCTSFAAPGGGGGFFSPSSSPFPSLLPSPTEAHPETHPLPRPLAHASLSMPHEATHAAAANTPSGSVSSTSSSGSYDDGAPDLAVYRYADPPNTPRGRSLAPEFRTKQQFAPEPTSPVPEQERLNHFPVSPKRGAANQTTYFTPEFRRKQQFAPEPTSPVPEHEKLNHFSVSPKRGAANQTTYFTPAAAVNDGGDVYSHRMGASIDTRSRTGSLSPGPRPRGYALQGSPVSTAKMFGLAPESPMGKQQDDQRSPHPLPLPPGSPTSPASSHSLQSKWKKGKLLGRGTFGHVYQGFHSESGQMCAIKEVEIISGDANSKECLRQLNQEINMLSQLSHPNIVHYYGSDLTDGTLSVYLEYVSGGSIHKLLQDYGPFSEPVIRSYAGQILSGLAYLHARNTIHRDIKGANILVGSNGEVKLADFGMAKHISAYTSIHSFKGSPYWMAPEVIMNGKGYSLPVDIWSLGCTIIEMASSKPPWNSFTGVQAIFKIGNSKDIPEIPDHLSNEAKSFVKLCLQRDPSARPTAAKLLEHPFVRDQSKTNFSMASTREPYHLADGTRSPTMAPVDLSYNRSRSPMRDGNFSMRHTIAHSPALKNPSEILRSLRTNMSLPVSPCSSPLRQLRQSNNRSCFPSPPHPSQALVNATSAYSTCSPYQNGVSNRYTDRWPDLSAAVSRSPYGSSRT